MIKLDAFFLKSNEGGTPRLVFNAIDIFTFDAMVAILLGFATNSKLDLYKLKSLGPCERKVQLRTGGSFSWEHIPFKCHKHHK